MLKLFRKSDPAENQKIPRNKEANMIIFQLERSPQLSYHATAPKILQESKKEEQDQCSLCALQTRCFGPSKVHSPPISYCNPFPGKGAEWKHTTSSAV